MQRQIFRQVALERLSSPEQLDQLMPITASRFWLALVGLLTLIVAALIWSFVARLPTQITGQGLLLRGGHALQVVSPAAGQITDVLVRTGDSVRKGQVVARITPNQGVAYTATRDVISFQAGQVAGLAVSAGGMVEVGAPILHLEDRSQALQVVMYVPAADGKAVRPGMPALVSSAAAGDDASSALHGTVQSVAALPASPESATDVLGSVQLAQAYLANGPMLEVHIGLDDAATGVNRLPDFLTNGAPCSVLITLAERRPIDLLIS